MIKQWKNDNLGTIYFHIPNVTPDTVLTYDGVTVPFEEFKTMSSEEYSARKITSEKYDYDASRNSEKLVEKANSVMNDYARSSNSRQTATKEQIENKYGDVEEAKPSEMPRKKIKVVKTPIDKRNDIKAVDDSHETNEKPSKIISKIKDTNVFELVYPKLMLVLAIVCSSLSIYFTATYLQRLQNSVIAYAISSAMLIYGLVGSQMTRRAWKGKHYVSAFIFGATATFTIGFSMLSSIDVNYTKYKASHKEIEASYNINDGKKLSYDLLKEELADNKKQIEFLNEDIKVQQKQYSMIWDDELKKYVVVEGRISSTAQQKIKDDNYTISKLTSRNKEINEKLMEYAESGVSVSEKKSGTDKAITLTDLMGSILKVSGNVIQLIFLLVPSFFIDIINILSLQIYVSKFED